MAITAAAGGGNWSAGGTWVGGIAPTAADDVLLTVTSGAITIDGTSGSPNLCRSLDCTGYTGTLTHASAKQLNVGDGTTGKFLLVAGMTYSPNAAAVLKFVSTTTGNNLTFAGKNSPTMTFDGVGGAWQFQDQVRSPGATQTVTLTNGTLDMNGQTVAIGLFASSNSNTRTLTLGAAAITIAGTATAAWDVTTTTGLTLTSHTSTITLTGNTGGFSGGGLTWYNLTITAPQAAIAIKGANTFNNVSFTVSSSASDASIQLYANQTVSGTLTVSGQSTQFRALVQSDIVGTARTITCNGTVTVIQTDFIDITGAGSASWNLSSITGGSGDGGGNSGITFNTPKNCYMKTAASANWSASNWYTTSGGSTLITPAVPLIQDTAIFDANSITAGSVTITANMRRLCGIDWTGVLNTPAFVTSNSNSCFGGIILVSGMTHTGTSVLVFKGRGSYNFDGGGLTWPTSSDLSIVAPGGTYTQQSNFTSNAAFTVTNGTWAGNTKTATFTTLTVNGGTYNNTGAVTLSGALLVSSGALSTGGAMTGVTSLTVSGGTFTVGGNITLSGALSVTGTITDGTGTTYTISGGTTLAVPAAGSLTIGSFSGTTCSNGILGTAVIGTLTLSGTYTMTSGSGNCTVGAGGMTGTTISISGASSTFTAGSGLINLSSTLTVSAGTVSFGSGGLTCTAISASGVSGTLSLGSGTITLTGAGLVLDAPAAANFNVQTANFLLTNTSASTKEFRGHSGNVYNNVRINGAASNGTVNITGTITIGILTVDPDASILWNSGTTYTLSGLVSSGTSGHVVTFTSTTPGSAATLSCANQVDVNWMSIKDSTASGNTPFYAGTNSTNVSGNTNWTFTARPAGGANTGFLLIMGR